ncbi:Tn3 family transposase [Arthrobacter sp. ISL-28]|nr:Tn3 family transposase [Arthrobacter sp. ISL-28]MBT2520157.1 Tn3 family transposase [Arthrobacter sp. ISL-28]
MPQSYELRGRVVDRLEFGRRGHLRWLPWTCRGEARNTLARAVFFNRLREIRDRSFEQQRYVPAD